MNNKLLQLMTCFYLIISCFMSVEAAPTKIVGYYPNWAIYRNPAFYPKDIDASLLTHINYAFVKIDVQGNLHLFDPWADTDYRSDWNIEKPYWGNFLQLKQLKEKNPHLKTLVSIGGWTLSDPFSQMAADPKARKNFVKGCIEFCEKYDFDGIDIDWEYPCFAEHSGQPGDGENYTLLLKELHAAAKKHPSKFLVTIAAPAGPHHYKNMEVAVIHNYLDWINLMTYDFHGPWGGSEDLVTNHHSPLFPTRNGHAEFNAAAAVNYYLSQGVPKEKLVLGMPLYGRSFAGVMETPDGLESRFSGAGKGTTSEIGLRFFSEIKERLLGNYERHWDDVAKVPYLYNRHTQEFITYDDEESLAHKCEYIKANELGGAMVWELGLDTIPSWDCMRTIHQQLGR